MAFNPGTLKTSFNSGEISPEAAGRIELKSYFSGASYMMRVEPVPQGGFDLMPGTVFEAYVRGLVAETSAPQLVYASSAIVQDQVLCSAVLSAAVTCEFVDFSTLAAAATINARFEWRASNADAWQSLPAFQIDARPRAYRAARAPGLKFQLREFRLVRTNAGAAATVSGGATASLKAETAVSDKGRVLSFQISRVEGFDLQMSAGNCDIFKNNVFQCALAVPFAAEQLETIRTEQERATMLLFHPDVATQKILRQSDADWLIGPQLWKNVPLVDLGGTYTKIADDWRVTLLIPASTNAQLDASAVEFTINGETTTNISLFQVNNTAANQHLAVAAAIKDAIEALAIVETGITVFPEAFTIGGAFPFRIQFAGDDNIGETFEVSARISSQVVSTAVCTRVAKGDPGGEEIFSPARGYARDGKFWAQRLVHGGFKSSGSAILASVLSSFFDLNTKIVTADGAVLIRPQTVDTEIIERIVAGRHLLIFTQDAEYFIVDRTLSRTSIPNIVQWGRSGCAQNVPVIVADNSVFWVNANNSMVYAGAYSEQSQSYDGRPISLLASHIVRGIIDAAYQRPSLATDAGRYFLLRSDGVLIVGSVIQEQEITGFVRWATDGQVRRVSINHSDQCKLLVQRTIGGQQRLVRERMDEGVFLDCCVTISQALSAIVSGLEVHEGREVWAVADGYVTGPFTVTGGQITIDVPATSITVGRWTPCKAVTLPAAREIAPNTVMLRDGRITAVRLHVLDTTSIAIGANGQPAKDVTLFRSGMAADVPLPPFSGPVDQVALVGFQRGPQVEITQVRPGRLKVRDLVYEMKG